MHRRGEGEVGLVLTLAILVLILFGLYLWISPHYRVWSASMEGQAIFAKAEFSKKAQIEQARAEKESALLRSEAIQIVGKASKDFPEYRHQEFIGAFSEALKEGNIDQIIYVPTEANIPIIEAKTAKSK